MSYLNSSVLSAEGLLKKKEARSKVKRDLNYCVLHGHKPTKAINDDTQIVKSFI